MPIRVSVAGSPGSGKSTVCKELAKKYNLKYYSTGAIQRAIAVEMGMDTHELNIYAETHPEIDELIDGGLIKLSDTDEDMAIDSRMAWHFVKDTFRVFLVIDENVAAERVFAAGRGPSEEYTGVAHAKDLLKERRASENFRFKEKYGVDCGNLLNYDLIIDNTAGVTPENIADEIINQYRAPQTGGTVFLISPKRLRPQKEGAASSAAPVKIFLSGDEFYIYGGGETVAEYLKNNKPLVPCELVAEDGSALTL